MKQLYESEVLFQLMERDGFNIPSSVPPYEAIKVGTKLIGLCILRNKLETEDINGLKKHLSQNPITVQYRLTTESVKTVELTTINESGETVYFMPLEGIMNVSSSSETIQPTFDMNVPVEAITQNLASFINMEMEE